MLPQKYMQVVWDDYPESWRCWFFHHGKVVEQLHCTDIAAVVALAQERSLPVDIGDRPGRLRTALRAAGIRLVA